MAKKWQKLGQTFRDLLYGSFKTPHSLLVTTGLLVGIIYIPFWFRLENGKLLMSMVVALGLYLLWQQRHRLAKLEASTDDRLLGHLMILGGVGLFPFCFASEWSQKLITIFILIGIAISSWGLAFFRLHAIPAALIVMGLFPHAGIVGRAVWELFTPPQGLERWMAWSGGLGLQIIGQSATSHGTLISLPGGTVDVTWGCSGFDMASTMVVAGILLGILLKQSARKIATLCLIGAILALLLNVPRIMLVAMANAYWGRSAFDFWHGFWGGQILSSILFTIYYYLLMLLEKRGSVSKTSKKA